MFLAWGRNKLGPWHDLLGQMCSKYESGKSQATYWFWRSASGVRTREYQGWKCDFVYAAQLIASINHLSSSIYILFTYILLTYLRSARVDTLFPQKKKSFASTVGV